MKHQVCGYKRIPRSLHQGMFFLLYRQHPVILSSFTLWTSNSNRWNCQSRQGGETMHRVPIPCSLIPWNLLGSGFKLSKRLALKISPQPHCLCLNLLSRFSWFRLGCMVRPRLHTTPVESKQSVSRMLSPWGLIAQTAGQGLVLPRHISGDICRRTPSATQKPALGRNG